MGQACTHKVMIMHHSSDETKCHKYTSTQASNGDWTERGAYGTTSHTGVHCGLTDDTDDDTCVCYQAGQHPTIGQNGLPHTTQGNAHDLTLDTTLEDHRQGHGDTANKGYYNQNADSATAHVRHNHDTEHGGDGTM